MSNILLVEPSYKNKYPPLALMKISTYHKQHGDNVVFCKGKNDYLRNKQWGRIYISTLFTFYWAITIDTIKFYSNSVDDTSHIFCGGVLATVLEKELFEECHVTILPGLIDKPGVLGNDDIVIDTLPADYSIIESEHNEYLTYQYPVRDAYIAYTTRGCIRKCAFCAVPTIEPIYNDYIDIKPQINYIISNFGEKRNLMLLDNNVLASKYFDQIIDDIKEIGFYKGAKYKYKKNKRTIQVNRYVDFNQGIDARLLTEEKCKKLSEIAIRPLRIAFDHADEESIKLYSEKVRLAASCGIEHLSNYVLFNFNDKPQDLYTRLKINVLLNDEFLKKGYKTQIFSFPMKFSPINGKNSFDRKHIGVKWNKKYLRSIQCILNVTHGVVGPKLAFFEHAFGKNYEEFILLLSMPEKYIMNRSMYEHSEERRSWEFEYNQLSKDSEYYKIILNGNFKELDKEKVKGTILEHYID